MIADIRLRKFDIKTLKAGSVVVLIGKRETGKSFLVRDILYHNKDMPIGTIISGTEGANSFYSHMVPSIYIYGEYEPQIIDNVIKRQVLVRKEMKKEVAMRGHTNIDPRAFLILDDCLYDASWTKDKNVRSLFMNGRHYNETFIITMQYCMGIPPSLRTNVDFVFILRENLINNRKKLYEQYAGMFPSFDIFCQVMDQCTENYECIVIHNNAKSNKLEDQVFWYKASDHEDFRVGAAEYWEYHTRNNDEQNEEEHYQEFDTRDPRARKRGARVNIHKYSGYL
jgi:hypothetical protein